MIWQFAALSETVDITQNVYAQWGFFGILALVVGAIIFVLIRVIVFLVKDNSALRAELKASYEARLTDSKDFSKLEQIPKDEIIKFIRTLYALSDSRPEGARTP